MMIRYKAMEMHTHTLHSDGSFTVAELKAAARSYQLDSLVLSDHNTCSGWAEIKNDQPPIMIRGIEWTTYYGHMVVIGAGRYIDWRFIEKTGLDEATAAVRAAGGACGVAHPFCVGSPLCTGCHWDFSPCDWKWIDYIELWSGPFPYRQFINQMAFEWWTALLNEGHHLAVTEGRDWHGWDGAPEEVLVPVTYLGLTGGAINEKTVVEALRQGCSYITLGPALDIHVHDDTRDYTLGERISSNRLEFSIRLDMGARHEMWGSFGIEPEVLRLTGADGPVFERTFSNSEKAGNQPVTSALKIKKEGWLRIELWGRVGEARDVCLAVGSPFYLGAH